MAGRNDQMRTGFTDLSGFDPTVENAFVGERHCPGATPGTTAVGAVAVGVELPEIIAAGFGDDASFLEVRLAECLQGLTAVVAGVVICDRHSMDCLVQLNLALLNIFKKKIKNGHDFEFFESFRVPLVQPGPGCKVCVASLG